jgi:regulator of protease activity HflC (stomatin/prohibitin superfamily)
MPDSVGGKAPKIDRLHGPRRRTIIFAGGVRDDVAEVEEVVMPGEAMLWIGIGLAALLPLALLAALFLVNVGSDRIALLERRFIGKELAPGRVFALAGEVGSQAAYLAPGLHVIPWPIVRVVSKPRFVTIGANELGIVEATDGAALQAGRIFADDPAGAAHDDFQRPVEFLTHGGIRGKQLRFLTNGTFKIHPGLFKVTKIAKTLIPEGSIGVITAADGAPLAAGQLLGRSVPDHDNFQKAEAFLRNGGQKGPQIDFLRPGTYNINTEIFAVEIAEAVRIGENEIGIVDARDGLAMARSDVVVHTPDDVNGFQDGQLFLDKGGKRGPQENILTPGTYYINPYMFAVSKRKQTVVRQGEVAVMISNIGKDPAEFEAGADEPHADGSRTRHVVPKGFRGIQREVLGPGAYNINPLAYSAIIIPTTTRSVDWSAEKAKPSNNAGFDPFQVVSHDGFEMKVEVRCQYRILPENAPYVVQKIGSIEELEKNVIHPQIDGIFRAQVSRSPAIAYQQNRAEEQKAAEEAVRQDLAKYRVEVVSVMITNIHLPEALMKTTQQKNLAEQEKSMYDAKKDAETRRIEFEKTKAEADAQVKIITAEAGIKVAQHEARQVEERAKGDASKVRMIAEAEATKTQQIGDAEATVVRSKGEAQAKAYRDQVDALTAQGVTTVEVMKAISAAGLKITPDILVGGAGDKGEGGLVQVLLAQLVRQQRADAAVAQAAAAPAAPEKQG